jgi:hypothetical protein
VIEVMRRAVRLAVLALLLLVMQHRGYVHPIEHFASRTGHPQETLVSAPQADAGCAQCALLASGANALCCTLAAVSPAVPPAAAPRALPALRAAAAGAWFDSRAPPVLL